MEYKIKVEPDGSITQLVGPSDHCSKKAMAAVKAYGWLHRPLRNPF